MLRAVLGHVVSLLPSTLYVNSTSSVFFPCCVDRAHSFWFIILKKKKNGSKILDFLTWHISFFFPFFRDTTRVECQATPWVRVLYNWAFFGGLVGNYSRNRPGVGQPRPSGRRVQLREPSNRLAVFRRLYERVSYCWHLQVSSISIARTILCVCVPVMHGVLHIIVKRFVVLCIQ